MVRKTKDIDVETSAPVVPPPLPEPLPEPISSAEASERIARAIDVAEASARAERLKEPPVPAPELPKVVVAGLDQAVALVCDLADRCSNGASIGLADLRKLEGDIRALG